MKKWYMLSILILVSGLTVMADVQMPAIFSDHMVLQRGKEIPIWGKADPGESVTVTIADHSSKAETKADGTWMVKLPSMKEGGPLTLTVQGKNAVVLNDVLIGEVWICSGQSNMEMPLAGWPNQPVEGSSESIAVAEYPNLRLFTVTKKIATSPQDDCEGEWVACTPQTAPQFSATGFFFGRKLYQELNIPVGMIHTSWGGTPAESWTSPDSLVRIDEHKNEVERIRNIDRIDSAILAAYEKEIAKWQKSLLEVSAGPDAQKWLDRSFDDSNWPIAELPKPWSATELNGFTGAACYRKVVEIPSDWQGQDLVVELGMIDDMDLTFFHGQFLGGKDSWTDNRIYSIAAQDVKAGPALLLVDVINPTGEGGFVGEADSMKIYPKNHADQAISLAGAWRYQKGSSAKEMPPKPQDPRSVHFQSPTVLYNGMIHPLVPYGIRGAIWYQGESNASQAKLYRRVFANMIENWREIFQQGDFPFYYDQIAPFNYGNNTIGVELREVQRETLSKLRNVGMAVLMDKTTMDNIHPPYKKEAGERMALWALAKDYGRDLVYSGPLYKNMIIEGNKIRLFFDSVGSGLDAQGSPLTGFRIAGADQLFHEAKAVIDGDTVVVSSPEVKEPKTVLYGWSNTATASLFNREGLPASSFRTDEW